MKKLLLISISLYGILFSCSEGSFARFRLKSGSLELVPSIAQGAYYYSGSDTLEIAKLTQGSYYMETMLPSPVPSDEVDKVEVQRLDYYASSTPVKYLVEYHLESIPQSDVATGSYDLINIRLVDGANQSCLPR